MKVHVPYGPGPFPVVIVSHGAGGNRDANFAQARHLATHGYIVVCIEHVGSNTKQALAGGLRIGKTIAAMTRDSDEVLNRPKDVSFAIDQVMRWNGEHTQLHNHFDLKRIGAMGHSFGAFTTLVVCGARPALDWMRPRIVNGRGLGPDLHDKRIRCGVALSPQGPGDPFFLKESYASICVPLLGISGSKDKQQNFQPEHRKVGFQWWPDGPHHLLWINNANHLSFSDSTGSKSRRSNRLSEALASRREDVQRISRAATLLFLDQHLKQQPSVSLSESSLRKYERGIADKIQLLKK
ncbi:alpha/beta hydrolase family protein [Stieleria marina]|uniref:alpha/beta hydrolase family protein n=1 Tax=Stieleria marina TaxID=1930275 RepID=UPI003AF3CCB0